VFSRTASQPPAAPQPPKQRRLRYLCPHVGTGARRTGHLGGVQLPDVVVGAVSVVGSVAIGGRAVIAAVWPMSPMIRFQSGRVHCATRHSTGGM
jgi:hypothetical protein